MASLAAVACGAAILSGCGGTKEGQPGNTTADAKPQYGGRVVYGIEAESADGWCLPQAQLAISGIQVARTIYDTLTAPNENGELVPFLAESLTPNDDFTEWSIKLRDGVKFHDGTALDATVVKNNIDAYRGAYPARTPLLFTFVFSNIKDVTVTDPLSLSITTNSPWSSLPQALWSSGRIGMLAQSQLDDPETCDRKLVGTGPFKLSEWKVNEKLVATRNPDYWQKDEDGNQLPYLDEIEYRPASDATARTNSLLAGDLTAIHTAAFEQIDALATAAEDGKVNNLTSDKFTEVAFVQMNTSKAPFDNKNARMALITAIDMETLNQTINLGLGKIANGPFAPGNMGYLKDTGYPTYDLDKSKEFVAAYKKDTGKDLTFTVLATPDPSTKATVDLAQQMAKKAGIDMKSAPMEQAALVSTAISGEFEAMAFRNFPGGDPDANHVWWYGHLEGNENALNPVNFSRYNDSEINRLLDAGRATGDKAERQKIYEDINRRFATEGYSAWLTWSLWDVSTATNVHGILGPVLPNGDKPSPALVVGHSVAGMWVEKS